MRRPASTLTLVVGLAVLGSSAPVLAWTSAQTPSATETPSPTVDGSVTGSTESGGELSMRVDASIPGGWRGARAVEFRVEQGERELERVTLDVDNNRLVIGDRYVLVGTEGVGEGPYLRVPASSVVITTGGDHLSVTVTADVLQAIPEDATFHLSVTDDAGVSEGIDRDLSAPGSRGFGWGTVLSVVAAALLAGAFAGNLIASRRRPPPRLSVYGAIQRRIDDERSSAGPR